MTFPKILIVIEHEPADKAEDGSTTSGTVIGVRANLPARYFDIIQRDAEVTERDDNGAVVGWQCDSTHPRGDVPFDVPVDPSPYQDADNERPTHRHDGVEEWRVLFWHGNEVQWALVLKAADVIVAAQRVLQEFPLCRIVSVEEMPSDDHPMTYLDANEIILPVGGPRVPTHDVSEQ